MDELFEKATPILRDNKLAFGIGVIGIVLLLYGLISYVVVQPKKEAITFSADDTLSDEEKTKEGSLLVVDVSGAVVKPGVYKIKDGSRFQDAVLAAGGMSSEADSALIAKQINLAAKLVDGAKVYIPLKGEVMGTNIQGAASNGATSSLININTASSKELDSLPGVGVVTSEKIIAARPYSTIEELVKKKVVSQRVFDEIKEKISIY